MSDRAIGRLVGLDGKTIADVRKELELSAEIPQIESRKVTRGISTYTQDVAKIGTKAEQKIEQLKAEGWPVSLVSTLTRLRSYMSVGMTGPGSSRSTTTCGRSSGWLDGQGRS